MQPSSIHPAIGDELVPPGEPAQLDELLAILREIQERKTLRRRPAVREFHPKQHGCVRAELIVEGDLPVGFRQGIFREERTFPALVRFSNSKQRNDQLPDAHGLAIKLLEGAISQLINGAEVTGIQDFVLIDHPVFFAKDVEDLVPLVQDFRRVMLGGALDKFRTLLKGMLSSDYRYRLLRATAAKRPDNPLAIQYWSTTPLKFGEGAAKISLRPRSATPLHAAVKSRDKLREAMVAQLQEEDAYFDFLVQRQIDPVTMPIEDASVAWDETKSPPRKVATLRIPRQSFDSAGQMKFGEDLSFTPWHAIPEHRPLGGINRARRKIYEAMAERRQKANSLERPEPAPLEAPTTLPRERATLAPPGRPASE